MFFSDFTPSNTVKLQNVAPTFSGFRPLLSYPSVASPILNNFRDQYSAFFRKARQLLVDFQLKLTPSLDFQVALNLGEPARFIIV